MSWIFINSGICEDEVGVWIVFGLNILYSLNLDMKLKFVML